MAKEWKKKTYLDAAVRMLKALDEKSCSYDIKTDYLLERCTAAYGDEKHIYRVGPSVEFTKSMPQDPYLYFWEEVTELCPVEVPEGCSIFFVTLLKLS